MLVAKKRSSHSWNVCTGPGIKQWNLRSLRWLENYKIPLNQRNTPPYFFFFFFF